ncbi:hypothetical protein [Halomonas denitrificans]|uniref:hypothetical protein n=1 Tax=Halomonas denitrificans TaxID=370769 RepID=UPI0013007C71|nr:hypothetical protein [Halomonas denitrificans]
MTMQARLLSRKRWYTLDDAARRLSVEFGEDVELEDIVQFVLDGDLQPSIYLSMVPACRIYPDDSHEAAEIEKSGETLVTAPRARYVGPMRRHDADASLDGIYHLHLTLFAIDAWRMWLQGEGAPCDEFFRKLPSYWYVTPLDGSEKTFVPCEIDPDAPPGLDTYESKRPPDIAEWIIARRDLDAFIASPAEQSPGQPTEGEELRALEALGLLAVTFAKGRGQYMHERSCKPNCAQIAKAMQPHAGEVYGMGERKLAGLISDALAAWEEKRG